MKRKILIISFTTILIILIGLSSFFEVRSENQSEIDKAIGYLKSQSQTAWSTMALAGAGETDIDLNHLKSVPSGQESVAVYAKYILALVSVGENPTTFGDKDYIEELRSYYQNGQFGDEQYLNDDMWAILALGSVGKEYLPEVQNARQFILNNQNSDGGWGFGLKGSASSVDMTAAAIMALIECGMKPVDSAIGNAKSYLKEVQNSDGGFSGWAGESSASSDAWAISAIYKLGEDPAGWIKEGKNPIGHLESLQDPEKGFFYDTREGEGEDSFVTARTSYAVIALSGKTYPIFSSYNLHFLQIEGQNNTICVGEVNGGTSLDLVIEGAKLYGFTYSLQYYENCDSFLVADINGEQDWKYKVNNILAEVGADNYYLERGNEVLWYRAETSEETPEETSEERQVGLRVEIEKVESQETISFSVNPDVLNFGKLKSGESSIRDLTISNGEAEVYLETKVSGASIFQNNLEIDEKLWQFFSSEIEKNQEKTFPVKLTVPLNYEGDFGQKEGELTFWAIKK